MSKPSREDVLKVAGEPVAYLGVPRAFAVYTEAQLLAMYAAGAEDMRERAKVACSAVIDGYPSRDTLSNDVAWEAETLGEISAVNECVAAISALPINT